MPDSLTSHHDVVLLVLSQLSAPSHAHSQLPTEYPWQLQELVLDEVCWVWQPLTASCHSRPFDHSHIREWAGVSTHHWSLCVIVILISTHVGCHFISCHLQVIFLECICDDKSIIERNSKEKIRTSPDYTNMCVIWNKSAFLTPDVMPSRSAIITRASIH